MYRWTRNRGCLVTAFIVLSVLSLLMVVGGDPDARGAGLVGLLMFGGGGLAWAVGEFATGPAEAPRPGSVRLLDGTTSRGLILPVRAGKARSAIVAQGLVAVASIGIVVWPDAFGELGTARWLFAGVALVLAISVVSAVRRWHDRDLFMALTPAGILMRGLGSAVYVPWASITSVKQADYRGILGAVEERMIGYDQSFALAGLPLSPEDTTRLVRHYVEHPEERSTLGSSDAPAPGGSARG